VTYWVHDGANLEMLRRGGAAFREVIAAAVRASTRVVFPSPEALRDQRAALAADLKNDVTMIRHGLPTYFAAPPLRRDAKRRRHWLVWPVSVERGLEAVLRHLDLLERAAGGALRLFVCHHPRGYHGDRLLDGHRNDPRVVVCGMLAPSKLALLYRRCSAFVFPSSVPEAFSIAAWECMAHGVVPVAYGLGALESLADCGALVAPPGDEQQLFRQAHALLADPARLDRTRRDMLRRVHAKKRDWPAAAAEWRSTVFGLQPPQRHRRVPRDPPLALASDDAQEAWIRGLLRRHDERRREEAS